jgi:hypothetical protein
MGGAQRAGGQVLVTMGRVRITARMTTVMLGAVIVALLTLIGASSP